MTGWVGGAAPTRLCVVPLCAEEPPAVNALDGATPAQEFSEFTAGLPSEELRMSLPKSHL